MMITQLTRCAVFICLCALWGCRSHKLLRPVTYGSLQQVAADQPFEIPLDTLDAVYDKTNCKRLLSLVYQGQHAQPGWHRQGVRVPGADSLIGMLRHTAYYGLPESGYHLEEVMILAPDRSITARQRLDVLLTDAYLSLSHDLEFGLLAPHTDDRDSIDLERTGHVFSNGGVVSSLESREPAHQGYRALKNCLRNILDSAALHGGDTIPMKETIRTIGVNLERWRQEQTPWSPRYVVVNIPAYRLDVIERGDTILSSRVIVGTVEHPTPELSSVIRSFTIYPYWVVPRKIAVEEYLPVIKADTTFFKRTDFEVLDRKGNLLDPAQIPWKTYHKNNFPVVLRQQEGSGNALGLIKFTFDNPYAVFLHDTNAKQLFRKQARALSHGCIRVEKAAAIARYLMTGSPDRESAVVRRYLDEQRQAVMATPQPLPIYVRYFTAEVTADGLSIHPDIYGRDILLSRLLRDMELKRAL